MWALVVVARGHTHVYTYNTREEAEQGSILKVLTWIEAFVENVNAEQLRTYVVDETRNAKWLLARYGLDFLDVSVLEAAVKPATPTTPAAFIDSHWDVQS